MEGTSIYGYYHRQEDLIHGSPWYKNDGISIWWNNIWIIGQTTRKGSTNYSFAKLDNNGTCLPKIPNQKWKLNPSSHPDYSDWYDAGNKVKVRCGYKPKGKYLRIRFLHKLVLSYIKEFETLTFFCRLLPRNQSYSNR